LGAIWLERRSYKAELFFLRKKEKFCKEQSGSFKTRKSRRSGVQISFLEKLLALVKSLSKKRKMTF